MILYHGGSFENLESIIKNGCFAPGHNDNPWSGENFKGLLCSNVNEYAAQYGDYIVEITIDENDVEYVQPCPLSEGDADWKSWMENAHEYIIPAGIKFTARFI